MDVMTIFAIQFLMSLVVWGSLAYWLLTPWLEKKSLNEALFFLTVPHAFRHIGMVFLVPGVVAGPLPETFAAPAALGDLLTGVLAFLALIALRNNWSVARAAVWLFSIVGTIDLINALRQGDAWMTNFGATWYIPTMLVPLLLVTQIMIFFRLFRGGQVQHSRLTDKRITKALSRRREDSGFTLMLHKFGNCLGRYSPADVGQISRASL